MHMLLLFNTTRARAHTLRAPKHRSHYHNAYLLLFNTTPTLSGPRSTGATITVSLWTPRTRGITYTLRFVDSCVVISETDPPPPVVKKR